MTHERPLGMLSRVSASSLGVFRGRDAVDLGVTRKQIDALVKSDAVERVLADTYRMTAVPCSSEQSLRAALLWAGPEAVAAGRSAAEIYRLEDVRASEPEILVPRRQRLRAEGVIVHRGDDRTAQMIRQQRGLLVTGMEPTLVALAASLTAEAFEIACEDARRRRLTSVPALRSYLERHGRRGRGPRHSGVSSTTSIRSTPPGPRWK